jgi:hypothetical protein
MKGKGVSLYFSIGKWGGIHAYLHPLGQPFMLRFILGWFAICFLGADVDWILGTLFKEREEREAKVA